MKVELFCIRVYQTLMERLIYSSLSRSFIAYILSVISHYMHLPTSHNLEATHKVLRYKKSCSGKHILYKKHGHIRVKVLTNIYWASFIVGRRSTLEYCISFGGNLIMQKLSLEQQPLESMDLFG